MGTVEKTKQKCKRLSKCASLLPYSPYHRPSASQLMIKQWEKPNVRRKPEWQLKPTKSSAWQLIKVSQKTNSQRALLIVRCLIWKKTVGSVNRNNADNKLSAINKKFAQNLREHMLMKEVSTVRAMIFSLDK